MKTFLSLYWSSNKLEKELPHQKPSHHFCKSKKENSTWKLICWFNKTTLKIGNIRVTHLKKNPNILISDGRNSYVNSCHLDIAPNYVVGCIIQKRTMPQWIRSSFEAQIVDLRTILSDVATYFLRENACLDVAFST